MATVFKNVRLSYPSLFNTAKFSGEDTGKYEATALFDKKDPEHMKMVEALKAQIAELLKSEFKGTKIGADKIALKDGDEGNQPGYFTLKLSTKRRPLVVDRDKSPLTEADGKLYAGCRVNIAGSLWAQNNNWGKRINGTLDAVQFFGDDEPMGSSSVSADIFGEDDGSDPFA